jgi:tetratricopeptide (TPR) repeat protein
MVARSRGVAVSRRAGLLATVAVALLVAGAAWWYGLRDVALPEPRPVAAAVIPAESYVGAETCASCHQAQFATWSRSTHGRAGGPAAERAVAPFTGVLRFANARVTPRVRSGSYEFLIEQAGEPPVTLGVDGVVGGGHIYGGGTQAYFTRAADGTWRMIPFEWSRQDQVWFCNTNSRSGRGWAPITPAMRLEECGDWPPARALGDVARLGNCQSCHASQATAAIDSAGGYATRFTSLAINCESCHGPGKQHVELARAGRLGEDIGLASLATLDKDASVKACYQCHALKDQLAEGYRSGADLETHYSLKLPLLGDAPLFPDGRIRTFAYQEGHSYSDCYLNGGMTCISCHDPHGQAYRSVVGEPLTGRFDDRQCTSCHLSKAEQPARHTKHPASVSCTSCHMPSRQEPETRASRVAAQRVVKYERSDHTISIPRPQLDSAYRFVSACAQCHTGVTTETQLAEIRALWGDVKPVQTKPYARFDTLARLLESVVPDTPLDPDEMARVRAYLASSDLDERAIALATLHLVDGSARSVRRTLARALRSGSAESESGLRARWGVALGFMGDRFAAEGQLGLARVAFQRATEVRPMHAGLALSLANATRDMGDVAESIPLYRRSLELDPRSMLGWVNYGNALQSAGDTAAALDAYQRARRLDPNEPLALFNLANIRFMRRELDSARALYALAAVRDPSLAAAQFQLARIALLQRDEPAALRALRRGLAFDSSDASAREMAAALARRAGGRE